MQLGDNNDDSIVLPLYVLCPMSINSSGHANWCKNKYRFLADISAPPITSAPPCLGLV